MPQRACHCGIHKFREQQHGDYDRHGGSQHYTLIQLVILVYEPVKVGSDLGKGDKLTGLVIHRLEGICIAALGKRLGNEHIALAALCERLLV